MSKWKLMIWEFIRTNSLKELTIYNLPSSLTRYLYFLVKLASGEEKRAGRCGKQTEERLGQNRRYQGQGMESLLARQLKLV